MRILTVDILCSDTALSSRPLQMALLLPLTEIASVHSAAAFFTRSGITGRTRGGLPISRPRVCACAKVKDGEAAEARVIRVSDSIRDAGLSPLFSSTVLHVSSSSSSSPPPSPPLWPLQQQQGDGGDDRQQYYVNLGYAIRTLREELPEIFYREPTFDIYRDDVVFKDPLNTFTGIENYKRIFWALRFNGRIFFKALWIDIVSVWQPAENIIMIRWIAHGIPRVPWEAHGRFDGNSEYKLDRKGKVFEHRVDNIAPNSPTKFRVMPVEELIRSLGCPSTPKPTYFETSLSSLASCMPFLLRFTWVRCYLAVYLTLALRSAGKG